MAYNDAKGGRPPLYECEKKLEQDINAYFEHQDREALRLDLKVPVYTMSGLALALGMTRKTLINYSKSDKFFHTLEKAKARVEQLIETRMVMGEGNATGLIFNAKNNFEWEDKMTNNNNNRNTDTKDLPEDVAKKIHDAISEEY